MKSPQNMYIIQIEITNACVYTCSNCTRMCGHHKKPFMMDFETFKRAVDSLDGYQGTISLMGGEPTMHPEFERFALYLKSKYPHLYPEGETGKLLRPATDFMKNVQDTLLSHVKPVETDCGVIPMAAVPGVYSVTGSTYLKHYELIQDVFKRQVLNDHSNEMYHQPALISRKDLGIPDEEWIPLRDNCWIQNTWSASITPKGAFFCEIAAALDMLLEGPGGWAIEKDWWKRKPEDFKDQLHWCELCGFACDTFTRNANEYIDDVSPTLYEKLKELGSPKVKSGSVNVIDVKDGVISPESKASGDSYDRTNISTGSPYIKYMAEKFNTNKSILHPDRFIALYHFSKNTTKEQMVSCQKSMQADFGASYVMCANENIYDQWTEMDSASVSYNLEQESYGALFQSLLSQWKNRDYVLALSEETVVTAQFLETFKKATPNPGTLIYSPQVTGELGGWLKSTSAANEGGFVGIFNKNASSFQSIGFDRLVRLGDFSDLSALWKAEKWVPFDEQLFVGSWKDVVQQGERCGIFGGGGRASDIFFLIQKQGGTCVAVVDSDPEKQETSFEHLTILPPKALVEMKDELDRILIGSPIYFEEMKDTLLSFGFPEEMISTI